MRRDSDPLDRRAKALTVTPAGTALVNRAVVAVERCDAAFFGALGDQLPALVRSLRMRATPPAG